MFSGTLVSRLLGMVRSPLLLGAAIGANLGVSDAFAVANKLPNVVYLLIAGGVLNAILVPALVRAMAKDDDGGQTYANRLITVFGVGLAAVTLVLTLGAQWLVQLYAGAMPAEWFDIAVAFAWWTVPQLFFYGMYTMLGQVLNARGIFGPYMWAPAVNNIVAIAGLFVYLQVFGTAEASGAGDPAVWTPGRIALLAGSATLGIVAQALILVVPLYRSGFRYRFDFRLRGSGLGRASRTAMWVFGAVLVSQISNILVSQAAAGARGNADAAGVDPLAVAGNQAYDNAYLLYSLPTSLVVVSLVTALFTRMSTNAATGEVAKVRTDTSLALRVVGVFTVFVAPAMMVLALPLTRILNAAVTYTEVRSIAIVLTCMLTGLVAVGAWTVLQRVYYAFEAARHLFWIQLPTVVVLAAGAVLAMALPPTWTVPAIGLAMALSNTVGVLLAYAQLRRYLPDLDAPVVARSYGRIALAAAGPVLVGWFLLHLLGTGPALTVWGAIGRTLLVGGVMVALYVVMLRALRVEELATITGPVLRLLAGVGRRVPGPLGRRLAGLGATATTPPAPQPPAEGVERATLGAQTGDIPPGPDPQDAPPAPQTKEPVEPVRDENDADAGAHARLVELGLDEDAPVIAGRYLLDGFPDPVPELPGEPAEDLILGRAVRVLRLDPADPHTPQVLDAARRAALVHDDRLLALLDVGQDEVDAWVVTEEIPGTGLDELLAEGPLSASDARAVLGEAASGLEAANRLGVHHLALEPRCIRVTRDGEVVVAGLGILAAVHGTPHAEDPAALDVISAARADGTDLVRLAHLALTGALPERGEALEHIDYPADTPEGMVALAERTLRDGEALVGPGSVVRAYAPWDRVAPAPDTAPGRTSRRRGGRLLAAALGRAEAARVGEAEAEAEAVIGPMPHPDPAQDEIAETDAESGNTAAGVEASDGVENPEGNDNTETPDLAEPETAVVPAVAEHSEDSGDVDDAVVDGAHVAAAGGATVAAPAVGALAVEAAASEPGTGTAGTDEVGTAEVTPAATVASADSAAPAESERHGGLEDVAPFVTEAAPSAEVPEKQSRAVLLVIAGLVVVALIAALILINRPPGESSFSRGPSPTAAPSATDATGGDGGDASAEPSETPSPTPTATPTITGLSLVDPEQRYPDHPEDLPLAMDGNPNSAWRTLWYNSEAFGNAKPGAGIVVTLAEPAMVSSITLDVAGEGGRVFVMNQPVGTDGSEVYAESALGRNTTIDLGEPREMTSFVLWFDRLPTATENGRYMIALHEIGVQ